VSQESHGEMTRTSGCALDVITVRNWLLGGLYGAIVVAGANPPAVTADRVKTIFDITRVTTGIIGPSLVDGGWRPVRRSPAGHGIADPA